MNILIEKLKNNVLTVTPIAMIVLVLNFTIAPIGSELIIKFLIGCVFIIIGIGNTFFRVLFIRSKPAYQICKR